uniref:NACHT domain-containing protein n=1 Tax=Candidatus Kentrum eta TaxID=2126337 RepID=A0A450UEP0_9GAMM|nr:MAG: NACHT domain-containing protein [Candidatus Kentron sp. H]VFJ92032.1 MAG: NACHT domain-containing protein [Candidatus Kentron sp. H]VFJ98632.1 MAG: NACHT domain-containing protein [Candidatus Kentron sp. H]
MPEPTHPLKDPPPQLMDRVMEAIANQDPIQIALGIFYAVLGALAASLMVWLALKAWRGFSALFWRFTARLGAAPGLSHFLIRGYPRQVRARFGTVRNIYLDREERLDLHRVFVPLPLRARGDRNRSDNPEIAAPRTTRAILTENPRLVILGAPGSGKTTLLKALASGVSQHQWEEWQGLIPVFVSLRAFSRATDEPALHDWLTGTLLPEDYGLRHAEPLLKRLLARGRLLLLLDGLDEVNTGDLSSVLTRITAFLEEAASRRRSTTTFPGWRAVLRFRSATAPTGGGWLGSSAASPQERSPQEISRVLLTCREQNYDLISDALLLRTQGMTEYRLADMRDGEVDAMVRSRREDFKDHGSKKGNKSIPRFLDAIRANDRVYQLHRNPLLLTLSIGLYLHRLDDAVPQHRTEFYDEGIRHLLRRHDYLADPQLGKGNRFEMRDKYALLCRFALASMADASAQGEDFEDFQVADLIKSAEALARNLVQIRPEQARELIEEIRDQAGLIADTGNRETYTFAHRSFHEYCAARELANLGDGGFERLQSHLTDSAWRQTVLFYCGMDHRYAERVVESLLDGGRDANRLELAGQCAAVLLRPQVGLRENVVTALGKALSHTDEPAARRLLLPSLLEVGRDAPPEVYAAVDEALRGLNPLELATNLGRLGKAAALPLLKFMVESGDAAHQKAALRGVMELEGLERIDLLWPLLAAFQTQGDTDYATAARRELLTRMSEAEAVGRLDGLPAHFEDLDEATLKRVYPFPSRTGAVVKSNFARLLKLEADAIVQTPTPSSRQGLPGSSAMDGKDNQRLSAAAVEASPWERFLAMVVSPKEPRAARDWQNLPVDRQRRIWSVPWQWVGGDRGRSCPVGGAVGDRVGFSAQSRRFQRDG